MGRWSSSSKTEADCLKKIEMHWLKEQGFLDGWKSNTIKWTNNFGGGEESIGIEVDTGGMYVRLHYSQTDYDGEKKDFDYKIPLTTTRCNYGGVRYWFICPLIVDGTHCGRRVGVLYKGRDYFGCRHCHDLIYSSQKENRKCKDYPLFRAITLTMRKEKLEAKAKRISYAGKLTKKQQKLMKICQELIYYSKLLK